MVRAEIVKVLFRGNGIDLSLPGVPAEKGFATYGKFLLEVIALRDNAASQLERKGRLMDLFVRAEKKDGKWTATDAARMYVEATEDDELILGALKLRDDEELPRVFFVKYDGVIRMFCTDSRIPEGRRRRAWPRLLTSEK